MAVGLSNTTSIGNHFNYIASKFDMVYAKRAFVHHFIARGIEEGEFSEVRESLQSMIKDCQDFCENNKENEEE